MKKEKIIILGMGESGKAVAEYLLQEGRAEVICIDQKVREYANLKVLSDYDFEKNSCDYLIVSPGISPKNPIYNQALQNNIEIIGEVEFALKRLNNPVIAVTGTNGKTTTTLLIGHVLNKLKKKAVVLGNSHIPLTSYLNKLDDEIVVLELSSYQLETLKSNKIDAAAILNITEDHLDRHGNLESYAKSKMAIAKCIKEEGVLFVEKETLDQYAHLLKNITPKTFGFNSTCDIHVKDSKFFFKENIELLSPDCYRDKSKHDVKNMMAAFALLSQVGVTLEEFLKAAADFENLKHRLEFVRDINGVKYYNDSKATNPDSVIAAVDALEEDIYLIVGGIDKKTSYSIWNKAFKGKVKGFFAIGETKEKIRKDLDNNFSYTVCIDLKDAFIQASRIAKYGDKILLSPGCASFDMFENYGKRGDAFKSLVYNMEIKNE